MTRIREEEEEHKGEGKEIYTVPLLKVLRYGSHLQITPYLPLSRKHSPDGATTDCRGGYLIAGCSLVLIYRPREDERLSRPSRLTCSRRFTHISGHPSAVGRALIRESSPVR